MNVCYFGAGRLGLSLAVWDAYRGHYVFCVDVNEETVRAINLSQSPIDEPGVQVLLKQARDTGHLGATHDSTGPLKIAEIIFILVPTPSNPDDSFDLKYILRVAEVIGRGLGTRTTPLVVCVSTIMPGDSRKIIEVIEDESGLKCGEDWYYCYSPEFVRQGSIVHDYANPDVLLIGRHSEDAGIMLERFYRSVVTSEPRIHHMSLESAEIAKIGLNTAVVAKMAVANQLMWLCHFTPGADSRDVLQSIGDDPRIGPRYFCGGTWPGGPCVPTGTKAQTERGLYPIEDIQCGDRVLAHDGEYHEVTEVYERWYKGPLVRITPEGFPGTPLVVTPDHPIWSAERYNRGHSLYRTVVTTGEVRLSAAVGYSGFGFAAADSLRKGDLLALPRVNPPAISPPEIHLTIKTNATGTRTRCTTVTPDLMYFFGWYISEGSTWHKEIKLSLHARELYRVDEIDQITRRYFGVKTKVKNYIESGNGFHTRTTSRALAQYLRETFGGHAHTKRVPTQWLGLPDEYLIQLLRGIWYGDGSRSGNRFTWATVSPNLFNFMRLLLLKLGVAFTTKIALPRTGRDGVNHRQAYFLTVANPPAIRRMNVFLPDLAIDTHGRKGKRSVWCERDAMFYHIKKTETFMYEGYVYNLEVKEANSYMLESAVVHNCFPRDQRALIAAGHEVDVKLPVAASVNGFHRQQCELLAEEALYYLDKIGGSRIGILGTTYKPGVSITEESQGLALDEMLQEMTGSGALLWDPIVIGKELSWIVERSNVLVVMVKHPELAEIAAMDLAGKVIIDCWGVLDEKALSCAKYVRLGKGKQWN